MTIDTVPTSSSDARRQAPIAISVRERTLTT
jgi:hypothetical protein